MVFDVENIYKTHVPMPPIPPRPYDFDQKSSQLVIRGRPTGPFTRIYGRVLNMTSFVSYPDKVHIVGRFATVGILDVTPEGRIGNGAEILILTKDHDLITTEEISVVRISEEEAKNCPICKTFSNHQLVKEWYCFSIWVSFPLSLEVLKRDGNSAFAIYVFHEESDLSYRIETHEANTFFETEGSCEASPSAAPSPPKPYDFNQESGRLMVRGHLTDPFTGIFGKLVSITNLFCPPDTVSIVGVVSSELLLDGAVAMIFTRDRDLVLIPNGSTPLVRVDFGSGTKSSFEKEWYQFSIFISFPSISEVLKEQGNSAFAAYVFDEARNLSYQIETRDASVIFDIEDGESRVPIPLPLSSLPLED